MPAQNTTDICAGFHFSWTCRFNFSVLTRAFCSRLCVFPHKGTFCASFDSWFSHMFPNVVRRLWRRAQVKNNTVANAVWGKVAEVWIKWFRLIIMCSLLSKATAAGWYQQLKVIYSSCVVIIYKLYSRNGCVKLQLPDETQGRDYLSIQVRCCHGDDSILRWIWFYSKAYFISEDISRIVKMFSVGCHGNLCRFRQSPIFVRAHILSWNKDVSSEHGK